MSIDTIDSPFIHTCDDEHFNQMVLENSLQGPILVNFWNQSAGPSLRMYPELDKLTHKLEGKFLLVNMDTKKCIKITKQLGISSVPTLKLFVDKEEVATLHGYQKEDDVELMLKPYLATPSDHIISQALQLYINNQKEQALQTLANQILEDPENIKLPLVMLKLLFKDQAYDSAEKLMSSLPDEIKQHTQLIEFSSMLDVYQKSIDQNIEPLLQKAALSFMSSNSEDALKMLFEDMLQTKNEQSKALLLQLLGLIKDSALTQKYRSLIQNSYA